MSGRQVVDSSLEDTVQEVLERHGVADALATALAQAGAPRVPSQPDACRHFFENVLLDVLTGRIHPSTARAIVDELLEHTGADTGAAHLYELAGEQQIPTVPPPAIQSGHDPYDDLASGAVHTRATPTWGLRRASANAEGSIVWVVISHEEELRDLIRGNAPEGTEVVAIETLGELKAALERGNHPASSVVVDAMRPTLPLDQLIGVLVEDALTPRVVLWRMDHAAFQMLIDAVPVARTWLSCEAEVTPVEIMQLIGA